MKDREHTTKEFPDWHRWHRERRRRGGPDGLAGDIADLLIITATDYGMKGSESTNAVKGGDRSLQAVNGWGNTWKGSGR